jgi:hypothetical protein
MMAIFGAYLDETGKFKDHKVVAVCGLVMAHGILDSFTSEWSYCLRRTGVPCLSGKTALNHRLGLSSKCPAKGIDKRKEALFPFINCIKEHFELLVGFAIDVASFTALPSETQRLLGKDPAYVSFQSCITAILGHGGQEESLVSLICDDEEQTAWNFYQLYRRVRLNRPDANKQLVSIAFANDKHFTTLQAADLVASLSRLEAGSRFHGVPYDYTELFKLLTLRESRSRLEFKGGYYNKESLIDLSRGILARRGHKEPLAR